MNKSIRKYDQPGKWEERISFAKVGEEKEWVGIVDARMPGEYELLVVVEHQARETRGRVTVRVVAGAGARVKVKGIIKIAKGAEGVEDFLELRALTIGGKAVVTLDPELEIEANQVKASHAASVGPIDQEQLQYLRSKGVGEEKAREEIIDGFLNDLMI